MEIIHILKSGEQLADITGHVVKKEDCPAAYNVASEIIEKRRGKAHEEQKKDKK